MNYLRKISEGNIARVIGLAVLYLLFFGVISVNIYPLFDGHQELNDFGSFYASGLKIQNGENPYDPNSEYIFEFYFSRVDGGGKMINMNPPISAMLFAFIARFDPNRTLATWKLISTITYVFVVILLAVLYRQNISAEKLVWAFTLTGFWQTLILGQIYIFLLLLIALGWFFIKKNRYIAAGMTIGILIAIKPNFAIGSIFLLISGYPIVFIVSAVSGLVISLIPALIHGIQIYEQWLEASSLQIETLILPGNSSILGLTARFESITTGIAVSAVLVIVLLYLTKSKSSAKDLYPEFASAFGIIASILASPIAWSGYTTFLLPIFFSLKKWTLPVKLSAAILSIPFGFVLQLWQNSFLNFVLFGWLYGWAVLSILGGVVAKTITTSSIQTN
jgi:hypothetical protein